jgi:hypothetical protein
MARRRPRIASPFVLRSPLPRVTHSTTSPSRKKTHPLVTHARRAAPALRTGASVMAQALTEMGQGYEIGTQHVHGRKGKSPPHTVAGHLGVLVGIKSVERQRARDPNFEAKHPRNPRGAPKAGKFRHK